MGFGRRIVRYGPSPSELVGTVEDRAIAGCWFELQRQGGCGRGELKLRERFVDRRAIEVGSWIACEYEPGDRWYLGRVESRSVTSPAGARFRLEGMAVQLGEVYPGGFGPTRDGQKPHRYGVTDPFSLDPDHDLETADSADRPEEVIRRLLVDYVVPATSIAFDNDAFEVADEAVELLSVKFNGEESVRSILKDLALRAGGLSWGVDETGTFFLRRPSDAISPTWQEGVNLVSLVEHRDLERVYNRLLLTGGYVYQAAAESRARPEVYRWRGHYVQPESRDRYGERRIRAWAPWIRTGVDAKAFAQAFLKRYGQPRSRYEAVIRDASEVVRPWLAGARLLDREGNLLIAGVPETVRVTFDHRPRLQMLIGIDDPRELWPEPPHDERWPIAPADASDWGGDSVDPPSFDDGDEGGGGGGGSDGGGGGSDVTSDDLSSDLMSDELTSSLATSSDDVSSDWLSSGGSWWDSDDDSVGGSGGITSGSDASSDVTSDMGTSSDDWSDAATSTGITDSAWSGLSSDADGSSDGGGSIDGSSDDLSGGTSDADESIGSDDSFESWSDGWSSWGSWGSGASGW